MNRNTTIALRCKGAALLLGILSGCSNLPAVDQAKDGFEEKAVIKIYQTRDHRLEDVRNAWKEYRFNRDHDCPPLRSSEEVRKYELIGCSYDIKSGILGDLDNFMAPVIDLAKHSQIKELKNTLSIIPLRETDIRMSIQCDDKKREEYIRQSVSDMLEVSADLKSKILGVHATYKNDFCNIFAKQSIDESDCATARLDVTMRDEKVFLNTSSSVCLRIATSCINPAFVDALYTDDIKSLFETYGPYVISGYYTGGRVIASYLGEHSSSMESDSVYKQMKYYIEAGVSHAGNSAGLVFSHAENYNLGGKEIRDNVEVFCHIQVKGGAPDLQVVSPPRNVRDKSYNIDLSDWYKSLRNPQNCYPIDITQKGLLGLENYVIETNFRRRIKDTVAGYLKENSIDFPSIEIGRVYVVTQRGKKLYEVAPILHTRHGDQVVFWNINYREIPFGDLAQNEDATVFERKADQHASDMGNVFSGIEIYSNKSLRLNPIYRKQLVITAKTSLDASRFKKFTNPQTGIVYLYNKMDRFAFSYPEHLESLITDSYTMTEWVESIDKQPISPLTLSYYTIIGL